MKKNKNIIIMIVILVSIAIVVGLSVILLDTTGIVNQGSFRINDIVVTSKVNVEEEEIEPNESTGLSDMKMVISQNNKISILVTKDIQAKRIYLSNISINSKSSTNNVYISQVDHESKVLYKNAPKEIEIYLEEKENQYFVDLNINNEDFVSNAKLPDEIKSVVFDGTLLKILGLELKDIQLNVKFDLNIEDIYGNKNICKFNLDIPKEELLTKGISISRENISDFVFRVK